MSRRLERRLAHGAALAACALLVPPAPVPFEGFAWTGVCTAHGVVLRPVGKKNEEPHKDAVAGCHSGCMLPRKDKLARR